MSPDSSKTALIDLILAHQWQSTIAHLQSTPADASTPWSSKPKSLLPIHLACQHGAPLSVIKALFAAHPAAVTTRSEPNGLLPLHCLFLVNNPQTFAPPSPAVLSFLLEANPDAARQSDRNGKLPLHHACQSIGITEDNFTALLSTYPEAAYARDYDGKFPVDYAASNPYAKADVSSGKNGGGGAITKKAALTALDRSTLYAFISKMTGLRLGKEYDMKLRSLEASHVKKLNGMESRFKDERLKLKGIIDGLQAELASEKTKNEELLRKNDELIRGKEEAVAKAIEEEEEKQSKLESNLRSELADVQLKNMDLLEELETVNSGLSDCRAREQVLMEEVSSIKEELEKVKGEFKECEQTLEAERLVLGETRDRVVELVSENEAKSDRVLELETSLGVTQIEIIEMAKEKERMKLSAMARCDILRSLLEEHDKSVVDMDNLMRRMAATADSCDVTKTKATATNTPTRTMASNQSIALVSKTD
ncbi:hypothetical protein ACHAXS_011443 [Conticribra weissflogii]